jgi:beta-D-galactosyl-(1->4)-L-rhamnose phosphorylase
LPIEVEFVSFDDILEKGVPAGVKVLINCGREGSAWSGGYFWENPKLIEILTGWVKSGGGLIGIGEPSALRGAGSFFRLGAVLGVDRDTCALIGHGKYAYKKAEGHFITAELPGEPDFGKDVDHIFALDGDTEVLADRDKCPRITARRFGSGRAVYMSGFKCTPENTRLIHRASYWAADHEGDFARWTCSNIDTECAWYPASRRLVVINNSGNAQETEVIDGDGNTQTVTLTPHGIELMDL